MASGNTKNFELKLGRAGLIILIVGTTALLCAAFLFGISVGKNIDTYPGKIALLPQRILALVWRPAKMQVAPPVAENKPVQNQPKTQDGLDLTYYNTLTSKKGVTKEQPIPDKKPIIEVPIAQQLLPPVQNVPGNTSVSSPPEVPKTPTATVAKPKDVIETKIKEAEKVTAAAGSANFSVQIASLKDKVKAEQLNKKISALGYAPRCVENNIPGKGKWFRVVIDGFASKPLAQAAAEKISDKIGTKNCIVRRVDVAVDNN
jgi:cell division septation protein DedD